MGQTSMRRGLILLALISVPASAAGTPPAPTLAPQEELGQRLFFDANLSTPPGQSCASCHAPGAAFTDPDRELPVSEGVKPAHFGSRNAPTLAYAAYSPAFHYDEAEGIYVGGQFLDGRTATLEEQAKGPFLNPVEMANPDEAAVVAKIRRSGYADLFKRVYGEDALDDVAGAFAQAAAAIAAFERTPRFRPFTSKYDLYLAGRVELDEQEQRGLRLFEAEDKGNCAACHPSQPGEDGSPPLFTDYTYDNLGVPKNPANPVYRLPMEFNPDGENFVDLGLGKALGQREENGKFKVPTLRNIALTAPYMHNGYFDTLQGATEFYNSRDVWSACPDPMTPEKRALAQRCWPAAEVTENLNKEELGDLGLTPQEVEDIVAFMRTLTDGYVRESAAAILP